MAESEGDRATRATSLFDARVPIDVSGGPDASNALVPVVRPTAEVAEVVGQATHVVLGAVLLVSEGIGAALRSSLTEEGTAEGPPTPDDQGPSAGVVARRVAVGAAFDAQRRATAAADATVKVVGPTVGWIASNPIFNPVKNLVGNQVEKAYNLGLTEETAARDVAARTVESSATLAVPVVLDHIDVGMLVPEVLEQVDMKNLVGGIIDDLDLAPIVNNVISQLDMVEIVNNVLAELDMGPIVERVLSDIDMAAIIGQVEVGNVVIQATGGMGSEILSQIRNRGADGDGLVEFLVAKVFRRRERQLPPVAFPFLLEEQP